MIKEKQCFINKLLKEKYRKETFSNMQFEKLSQEELNKRADELKQRAHQKEIEKQKAAPKLAAQKELERRKDVLMQVELKRQQDERKRQLDI